MLHLLGLGIPFVGFFDIFETLSELDFVIRVLTFSYLLFWLYMTFVPARAEILFGLAAIVAAYLIFAHGVSITILVLFFLFFILLGSQLQMILMFGVLPLLGYQYAGDRFIKSSAANSNPETASAMANQYYRPGFSMAGQQIEEESAAARVGALRR